jgi:hypothetical protein
MIVNIRYYIYIQWRANTYCIIKLDVQFTFKEESTLTLASKLDVQLTFNYDLIRTVLLE